MLSAPTLLLDRDGTLIEEPADSQVDSLSKIRFMPGVFAALSEARQAGYTLVMVTNQDGLGTQRFPRSAFDSVQAFVLDVFESQGIEFDAVFVCPHMPGEGCACRKPKPGLVAKYVLERAIDRNASAVVGDRDTDLELAANLHLRGFTVRRHGVAEHTWPHVVKALLSRRAEVLRETKETQVHVWVDLDQTEPALIETGIGFFDHMLSQLGSHGGFSLELSCQGDLKVDEHHTVEDSALALGQALRQALGSKEGIARYGFLLPMDESEATVSVDLAGRAFARFNGRFERESVGAFPTELVPHFFRSLSEGLGAAIHVTVRGENTHHMVEACFKGVGRALRQAFRREGRELPSTKGVL
jgi:imidazoleglycerol-phosphate dehydratase / histidinol-phosphatase